MRVIHRIAAPLLAVIVCAVAHGQTIDELHARLQELHAERDAIDAEIEAVRKRIDELLGVGRDGLTEQQRKAVNDIVDTARRILEYDIANRERWVEKAARAKIDRRMRDQSARLDQRTLDPIAFRSRSDKTKYIRGNEARLAAARRDLDALLAGTSPPELEQLGVAAAVGKIGLAHGWRVQQVVDEQSLMAGIEGTAVTVWFEGIDTSTVVDGRTVDLAGAWLVTGTRQYETVAGGLRTVYVAEPIDFEAAYRKLYAPPPAPGGRP